MADDKTLRPVLREFLAAWQAARSSPAATARALGIDIRHVYRRRQELVDLGYDLPSAPRVAATARAAALAARGVTVIDTMSAVEITDQFNADGQLQAFSVRQRPETAEALGNSAEPLPGFVHKRISTLYGRENEKLLEWQIQQPDLVRRDAEIRAAYTSLADELPRAAVVPAPAVTNAKLCNVYTFTDYHMGMLAWHKEGGADWDIKIASQMLSGCFDAMIAGAPAADTCVIAQLGDFLHYDGLVAATPTSGHPLDADGRFSKMVQATIAALRGLVNKALAKHRRVIVLMAEGNHDLASSVWLRHMFKALYEDNPRVEVIDSELPYYAFEFGTVMLGWHHTHLAKMDSLTGIFAAQFRAMWGRCSRVYIHTGHFHHRRVKEDGGAIVEQHPTLAARDAYSARGGYQSERAAIGITYHADFGEVARNTVRPEMLDAA